MKLIFVSSLLISNIAFGALPPYWDSVKKMEAVLKSEAVAEAMGRPVQQVIQVRQMTYRVVALECSLNVTLKAHVPNHPGPTTYSVAQVVKSRSCK